MTQGCLTTAWTAVFISASIQLSAVFLLAHAVLDGAPPPSSSCHHTDAAVNITVAFILCIVALLPAALAILSVSLSLRARSRSRKSSVQGLPGSSRQDDDDALEERMVDQALALPQPMVQLGLQPAALHPLQCSGSNPTNMNLQPRPSAPSEPRAAAASLDVCSEESVDADLTSLAYILQ